ncbi:MAG: carbohydrate kinase family protein [Thermoguttaceae bacterium]
MNQAAAPIVVGLGELLWDCFADWRRPGGAPANVAFHACQLGLNGIVCSRVGTDPLGDQLLAFLQSQGLRTDWVQRDREYPTGTVSVDVCQPDHPRFVIHENAAWDWLEFDAAVQRLMGQAAAVCFGTLAQRAAVSRQTIFRALKAVSPACLIVYDVNLRPPWYQRPWVERSLDASQLVKLNAEEAIELARLLELSGPSQIDFARTIQKRHGVQTVCITRGEGGCLLVGRDEVADRPGVRVEVADSVGAGDAFTAALIFGQLRGWPLARQASFANQVGALVASQPGAMPVLREQFARLAAAGP